MIYKNIAKDLYILKRSVTIDVNSVLDDINIHMRSLPSGPEFGKTTLDVKNSTERKLIFDSTFILTTSSKKFKLFGFRVTVTPSLLEDFEIKIVGTFGRYQDLKEYLQELYFDIGTGVYDKKGDNDNGKMVSSNNDPDC